MESNILKQEGFTILSELGQGAYGEVYLGEQIDTKEKVAIKSMDQKFLYKQNKIQTVEREISILTRLNTPQRHPNIIQLIKYAKDKQNMYLVYDMCSGGSLQHLLSQKSKSLNHPIDSDIT